MIKYFIEAIIKIIQSTGHGMVLRPPILKEVVAIYRVFFMYGPKVIAYFS